MPTRRDVLATGAHACTAAFAVAALPGSIGTTSDAQRFMLIGLTGPDDPTRASLLFAWANALTDAGHIVRLELAGEATRLMLPQTSDALTAPGLPSLKTLMAKTQAYAIPISLCRPCALARGITETDLEGWHAQFTNASVMAATMAWAAKVLLV
jgi:predicted peroxiredoxin